MKSLVRLGESIEGLKVDGQSRKPLDARALESSIVNGKMVYVWVASFDVRARIVEELGDGEKPIFESSAYVSGEYELIARKVLVKTFDRGRPDADVSKGSATHQANFWHFRKRTSVRITQVHDEFSRLSSVVGG